MLNEKESIKDLKKDYKANNSYVDNKQLSLNDYTCENGSLIVNLKDNLLNTLSEGKHTLRIDFTDGSISSDFTIKERSKPSTDRHIYPKTGIEK
ncbi:MAG: hypothetical protein IKF05_02560 [Erysipelotrichaceae bacterium]|nr:hypothetical protein [Erysipelotrichaceae bacterium]